MLRDVSLLHAEPFDQFAGGEFPIAKQLYNCNPSRVRQCLEGVSLETTEGLRHCTRLGT